MNAAAPHCAYIAVGANIDPAKNIPRALELLAGQVKITGVSSFYITRPLGRAAQPDYRNGAVRIETTLPPRELKFNVLRPIEASLGRVRSDDKYAAREIDLDILLYDDLVIDEVDLSIPDPDLQDRIFLVLPMLDLCQSIRLPQSRKAVADLEVLRSTPLPPVDETLTAQLKERFTDE